MLRNIMADAVHALRLMAKRPAFTALAALMLALGIGSTVAVFGTIHAAMIRPLPFSNPERLVMGRATFSGRVNPYASAPDYYDYRDNARSFESLAAVSGFSRKHTVNGGGEPEQVRGVVVSVNLFPTLGVAPQLGRQFTNAEGLQGGPPVAILSHGYWQRRFAGSSAAIGSTLTIDGTPHTVVGVMPAGFNFLFPADVWRPMRPNTGYATARRFHNWLMVGRLRSGVNIRQAQSEVDVISRSLQKQYPDSNKTKALLLAGLQSVLTEDYRPSLFLLMGAVSLVLLIACANVAGLLLARGSARRTELAIRAALGASQRRLVSQLLSESVLLSVASGILGTALSVSFLRLIPRLLPMERLGMEPRVSLSMLLFALLVSVGTGVLFGIVPALRAARLSMVGDLRTGGRTETVSAARFRSCLVAAQVALSVALLAGSGLLIRSFGRIMSVDPGFNVKSLLTAEIRLPANQYDTAEKVATFYERLNEDVRAIPGVEAVGIINQLPIRDPGNNLRVWPAGGPPPDAGSANYAFQRVVLPGYFRAMGIPIIAGRDIDERDQKGAPQVIVISQQMAKTLFPNENALGRSVVVDAGQPVTAQVVGVVGEVRMTNLTENPRLAMYSSWRQMANPIMRVAIRTHADPESIVRGLRASVARLDANIPLAEVASMETLISESLIAQKMIAACLTLFALAALLLSAIGLYAMLAYYVAQRRREIGVRIALGATAGQIVRLVVSRAFFLVAAGVAGGLGIALGASRLLQELLFGVKPDDPLTLAFVALFFIVIALGACLVPAWRATRVDPLIALQAE